MTKDLKFGRKAAASGKTRSLVVFLHGYGANGADLLDIGDVLATHLPDTVFMAPDAPDPVPGAPFGFQWFSIPRFDGSSEAEAQAGLAAADQQVNRFLDQRLAEAGLTDAALALVGFSQGAMMALQVAPRRAVAMAGVVSISGRLINPERLAAEARVRPPVLVMHGDQDPVVEFDEMAVAGEALVAAEFPTYGHVMKGMGHGISQDGLATMMGFLTKVLPG
ncbi:MAG: dienelactone hydrolase family protein [bacterium]